MVEAARIAYRDYPTVVNEVGESGLSYDNTMAEYAKMDSMMQSAQKAIGGSSDTAQLSQSYYWSEVAKPLDKVNEKDKQQYYENTVILAVCAQLAIDGCKRQYEVDVNNDIRRIRSQPCMKKKKDFPKFMKWTHEIPLTKNGKERPQEEIKKDKEKVIRRIDESIVCPMNWLQDCLDKIQGASKKNAVNTEKYYIHMTGQANGHQISKIRKIIEEYDTYTRRMLLLMKSDETYQYDYVLLLASRTDELLEQLRKLKLTKYTMNRLIGSVLNVDRGVRNDRKYKEPTKYISKILSLMHRVNKDMFLSNFKKS